MVRLGWSVLRFWNIDVLAERSAVLETILAAIDGELDPVEAADLRFVAAPNYRETSCECRRRPSCPAGTCSP
jgi:hypothetical protein